ncbi:hypothetical protein ACNAN0_09885 [Agrilactobacillus fermenti]|uniref:hypothetical protein n=1 Tax=Agrilactobacillus fermenti TaxID=2586909 RepID=UPI001E2D1D3D|nr:hypothetical protein [Agrilactobacillus fermenti]MCD2255963.1 hypothetical protein [Agrilactobacillus fermenti]
MSESYLYIHLETVTNMILSYGISMNDFVDAFKQVPEHLLLLSDVDENEMIDPHTGFNVISGREDILRYLLNPKISRKKWIDYKHTLYLDEITPFEVSELLYLGHAYTHLSSPFYYKLANQYVYLELPNEMTKVYYRHLEDFHRVLSNTITRYFEAHNFQANFLFKRHVIHYVNLDNQTLNAIHELLVDGVLFDFTAAFRQDDQLIVPLFQLKHRFVPNDIAWSMTSAEKLGTLEYNREVQQWAVKLQA